MFRTSSRYAILMVTAVSLGCSSLDVTSLLKRHAVVEAGPTNPVVDVVCLWEPAEGRGLDNLPSRGFAGQLLFLTRGSAEPARIDGDVRVYLFDDQGSLEEQGKPLHQFDFGAEAFDKYFYETSFGAAYQLFVPYTRKGPHEARCGLRVRFTPARGGPPVYSKMADITLPGAKPKSSAHRWNPEHRQLPADALHGTGAPPSSEETQTGDAVDVPTPSRHATKTASIPLPRGVRADQARSRLQKLAAQLAASQGAERNDTVEHASYEVEAPAEPAPRRFRLHREEP